MKLVQQIHYIESTEALFKFRYGNGIEVDGEFWFVKFLPLSGIMYAECGRQVITLTYNLSIDLDSNIDRLTEVIKES